MSTAEWALGVSLASFGVAGLSLFLHRWDVRRSRKRDLRVRVRHDYVTVGERSYEVTVVATNKGGRAEHVESVGLIFDRDPEADGFGGSSTNIVVDETVPPEHNVHRTIDLGAWRFRPSSRAFRAYAKIAGEDAEIYSEPDWIDERAWAIAGLTWPGEDEPADD